MPENQNSCQKKPRHQVTTLKIWVPTSGCWTIAGVALPHSHLAVWVSLLAGLLLAAVTTVGSNKLEKKNETRAEERQRHILPMLIATLPTLLGLVAYAYASHADTGHGAAISGSLINPIFDLSSDKSLITQILLGCYVAEQILPSLGKFLRATAAKAITATREWFRDVVIEAMGEGSSTRYVPTHAAESPRRKATTPTADARQLARSGVGTREDTLPSRRISTSGRPSSPDAGDKPNNRKPKRR